MDLLDGPLSPATPSSETEVFMRRIGKIVAFSLACTLALVLTVHHTGQGLEIGPSNQLRAAVRGDARRYDLSDLPIVSKTLFYVRENYFDKNRLDPKKMLVGALDWIQRDVPEIIIDRWPEHNPRQVTIKVGGQQRAFDISSVDAPWSLRAKLKDIFAFVQPNLQPVPEQEEGRRLVEIEMAATNGMLDTLDPHSSLMDVESYKDMRTQTQAKFGGLGIVIGMDKKGHIVVRRPMKDTPAFRAGIKAKDRIVRINNESTVNMTLTEAVERMRGDPNDPVDIYIERDGVQGAKKYTIVRDYIHPPSIDPEARVLPVPAGPGQAAAKIGYFHLSHFSASSDREVQDALALFERERVKGIVVDVRGNPGGLYDQAQKVADAFIESGTIVSTVGVGGSQRDAKEATPDHEPKVPVAILVDQFSASASEILAGAIKNLDRGVVVGETTYGKGSVQVLYDIVSPVPFGEKSDDDKLGLRLTIAQYLTPGDISIQAVGVTPDVETVPLVVEKEHERSWIRLQASAHRRKESDYQQHLDHPSARRGEKPLEIVSYLQPVKPAAHPADDEEGGDDESTGDDQEPEQADDAGDFKLDFDIEFARDLLAQAKGIRRRDVIASWKGYLDRVRAEEDRKLVAALGKLGVDWSGGPGTEAPPSLALSLQPLSAGTAQAGDTVNLRGLVRNTGSTTAYRVRAVLESENLTFDENEMVFGRLAPGESKGYDLQVKIPPSTYTRTDVIKATLASERGADAAPTQITLNIAGRPRPLFAYSYQTIDDVRGNRDGLVQRGEQVRMLVTVKNIGPGKALHTELVLRNGPGQEGILISAGRFDGKELAPGETKTFNCVYEVGKDYKGSDYQLDLMVGDTTLGESLADRIRVKIAGAAGVVQPAGGTVTVSGKEASLREAPADGALVVGRARRGAAFKVTGREGPYTRVELDAGRPAFVATSEVRPGGAPHPSFDPEWLVTPPVLTATAPTMATGDSVHVKGTATDDRNVRDVFIKVWNRESKMLPRKVFYKPARENARRIDFDADVPLWPGSNLVQVYARETNEIVSVETFVVLRRNAPSVVAEPALAR